MCVVPLLLCSRRRLASRQGTPIRPMATPESGANLRHPTKRSNTETHTKHRHTQSTHTKRPC